MSAPKTSQQRHRDAVAELKKLIPGKPVYPRSNVQLAAMLAKIEYLKKTRQVLQQLQQQWKRRINEFTIKQSFSGRDKFITFSPESPKFNRFHAEDLPVIVNVVLPSVLKSQPSLKIVITYNIDMHLATDPTRRQQADLNSKTKIVYSTTDLGEIADSAYSDIARSFDKFTSAGSGWVISRINYIKISTHEFTMTVGGSYVQLPEKIIATKSCINVKNRDEKCAIWALLSAKFPAAKNSDRVSKYEQYQDRLDLTGINFPSPVKQISQIQRQNSTLFPSWINVFSLDDSLKPIPLHIAPESKHHTDNSVVNLLWWNNHYCWIKDFSRFARSSITAHHGKMLFCYSCLTGFTDQQKLRDHNKYCYENTAMITPAPGKDILCFRKPQREIKMSFIIYGDFESFIVPVKNRFPGRKTNRVQKHVSASYCLNTVCVNDKYSKLSPVYRVNSVSDLPPEVHMLKYLFAEQSRIQQILSDGPEKFTTLESYKSAVICYVCKKSFAEDFHDKVPFVDVIAGNSKSFSAGVTKYIGAVHESCRQFQKFIPVVFHNLRGYDGHFILRALGHPEIARYCKDNTIRINYIPSTSEKLLSLTIGKLRFIDSIHFMNSSLDNLARNCSNLRMTRKYFPDDFVSDPLISKGVFPYEYFTDPGDFDEPSLPPKEAFYSSLYDSDITTKQYEQALQAWDLFQCKNFGDYRDAYLQLDVLLLSDVFEEFRTTSLTQYGLDPAHYFSAPGLSWDAALKHSKVERELLTDPDMYLFIEKGTRGVISIVTKKYSIANNKYLHVYDPEQPSKYICYLDANNLYEAAMSMPMPYGGFAWITPEEFLAETSNATVEMNPNYSYFIEVDVDYPTQLHDLHNDYPYLPEHMVIHDDMLSREQLALRTTKNCEYHKLVPNLFNKHNYICHYALLKQSLDAGLVLRTIHKVLRFNHSCWLKTYISANTTRRTAAKSDFE